MYKRQSLNRSLHDLKQSEWKWAGLLVETVVEYDMEQCRTDPCVFRMDVDGKVELIIAVHADDNVTAGSDETCREFHATLFKNFLTSKLREATWYTGCAFEHDSELGTSENAQKVLIESKLNRFGVNSSSIPSTPGVELGPREEDEPRGDLPYNPKRFIRSSCDSLQTGFVRMSTEAYTSTLRCCSG